jgi:hypothetical protein
VSEQYCLRILTRNPIDVSYGGTRLLIVPIAAVLQASHIPTVCQQATLNHQLASKPHHTNVQLAIGIPLPCFD